MRSGRFSVSNATRSATSYSTTSSAMSSPGVVSVLRGRYCAPHLGSSVDDPHLEPGLRLRGRAPHDRPVVEPEPAAVPRALDAAALLATLLQRTASVGADGVDRPVIGHQNHVVDLVERR